MNGGCNKREAWQRCQSKVLRPGRSASVFLLVGTGLVGGLLRLAGPDAGKLVVEPAFIVRGGPEDGSNEPVKFSFDLSNVGRKSVTVLSLESGCGCSVPVMRNKVIPPGGSEPVTVEAMLPPTGKKLVPIVATTDSPDFPTATCEIELRSRRTPPYLINVHGDLVFEGSQTQDFSRRIKVFAAQEPASTEVPSLACDLPFVEINYEAASDTQYPDSPWVEREHAYLITVDAKRAGGTFSGSVTIADPWDNAVMKQVPITGKPLGAVRVAPSRVIIRIDSKGVMEQHELLVLCDAGTRVTLDEGYDMPFELDLTASNSENEESVRAYRLTLRPKGSGPVEPGAYSLRLLSESLPSGSLTVPVRVIGGS